MLLLNIWLSAGKAFGRLDSTNTGAIADILAASLTTTATTTPRRRNKLVQKESLLGQFSAQLSEQLGHQLGRILGVNDSNSELRDSERNELQKSIHAILQGLFAKMDLVTREEFDAQQAVLRKTQAQVDELEDALKQALEKE